MVLGFNTELKFFSFFQMDSEIPCRDTDLIESDNMAAKGETLASTIDFNDHENNEESAKRFERFAQRSSQRRVNSPRLDNSNSEGEKNNKEKSKQSEDKQRTKLLNRENSDLSRASGTRLEVNDQNSLRSEDKQKTTHKEKQEDDDEVKSSTGTYTMDEEEDLEKVNLIDSLIYNLQITVRISPSRKYL